MRFQEDEGKKKVQNGQDGFSLQPSKSSNKIEKRKLLGDR